jgi:hypothetical protein
MSSDPSAYGDYGDMTPEEWAIHLTNCSGCSLCDSDEPLVTTEEE